jgi:hypothetical protein
VAQKGVGQDRSQANTLGASGAVECRSAQGHLSGIAGAGLGAGADGFAAPWPQHVPRQGLALGASCLARGMNRQHHPGGSAKGKLQPSTSSRRKEEGIAVPCRRATYYGNYRPANRQKPVTARSRGRFG